MKNNKFLVLLFTYHRPRLFPEALTSILESAYRNYEVAVIDDYTTEEYAARSFVNSTKDSRIKYYPVGDTLEGKKTRGGSLFGKVANDVMVSTRWDVGLCVCDDDAITPWYLEQLNDFYKNTPIAMSSYCDVIVYDATKESWRDKLTEAASDHFLNTNKNPHNMFNSKDSSQGSWRWEVVQLGTRWNFPQTAALDAYFWNNIYIRTGPAYYNGVLGQVKNYSDIQLGRHGSYDRVD